MMAWLERLVLAPSKVRHCFRFLHLRTEARGAGQFDRFIGKPLNFSVVLVIGSGRITTGNVSMRGPKSQVTEDAASTLNENSKRFVTESPTYTSSPSL
jgi:hypothetical protein